MDRIPVQSELFTVSPLKLHLLISRREEGSPVTQGTFRYVSFWIPLKPTGRYFRPNLLKRKGAAVQAESARSNKDDAIHLLGLVSEELLHAGFVAGHLEVHVNLEVLLVPVAVGALEHHAEIVD